MARVNTEDGHLETGHCDSCDKVTYIKVCEEFCYCTECGLPWVEGQ